MYYRFTSVAELLGSDGPPPTLVPSTGQGTVRDSCNRGCRTFASS